MAISIFWFRRDLRLSDNAGLYQALKSSQAVQPVFIFDRSILDQLPADDARVTFIHDIISDLSKELDALGCGLQVYYGTPQAVWPQILADFQVEAVYCNEDYEPYALQRDEWVETFLSEQGIGFHCHKDHVVFSYKEVLKDDGTPYTVFTPYSKKWKQKLGDSESSYLTPYPTESYFSSFHSGSMGSIPSLAEMGFQRSSLPIPDKAVTQSVIRHYDETRNFPALKDGTSRLGIHFRFGTISIRQKARKAMALNETFLNELIWRDFYFMILGHFPRVTKEAFRPAYDQIEWRNNEAEFKRWCEGKTGYPIVDAGMRQLNATGYMHNRVRMVVASFLTKHLLIDWRWGEAYFAEKLLDFELASNNGGWQWAAGSGTDAAPYFRIFNPQSQQEKFDKDLKYIRTWVREYGTKLYPDPIVDHKLARERCLEAYKKGLGQAAIPG